MARILIVDNEFLIRELLMLQIDSYTSHKTVAVEDGAQALALIDAGGVFDLIITDLHMPIMTGSELIEILRSRGSAVPIILLTGDVRSPAIEGVRTMRKPCEVDDLIAAVAQVLSPPAD